MSTTIKKIIATTLIIFILAFILCACAGKIETKREIIDWSYTAPGKGIKTEYDYKYNWLKGEFVLLPNVSTLPNAVYKILYRITYDDGSTAEIWEEVTAAEYEEAITHAA